LIWVEKIVTATIISSKKKFAFTFAELRMKLMQKSKAERHRYRKTERLKDRKTRQVNFTWYCPH
jgi:hypothetical protein